MRANVGCRVPQFLVLFLLRSVISPEVVILAHPADWSGLEISSNYTSKFREMVMSLLLPFLLQSLHGCRFVYFYSLHSMGSSSRW